jgi:alpha-glucuronidase
MSDQRATRHTRNRRKQALHGCARLLAGLTLLWGSWLHAAAAKTAAVDGLVGHWTFDDGTGRDVSGQGNDFTLGQARVHPLSADKSCLQLEADRDGASVALKAGSPLAIERGTICFWLNMGVEASGTVLEYDNQAVELNVYRSHFTPRFRGEKSFRFANVLLGDDWPKFLLRESAFYPHEKAVTGEGEWHHFAVAYDDRAKRIVGWRDGELIATIDLSTVAMEPLRRDGLKAITTGKGFSGFIDELRVYNRPLGDADIAAIYAAERDTFAGRNDAVAASRQLKVYSYAAEDRTVYRAWLQHRRLAAPKSRETLARIVASAQNPTVQNAARELAAALGEMVGPAEILAEAEVQDRPRIVLGTPETSAWVRTHAADLGLDSIRHDGYVVKTMRENDAVIVVVAAVQPAGVVFGTFDLIRRLQLGADPAKLDHRESPTVPIRLVNHWDIWRGFPHDDWRGSDKESADSEGNRSNSIYSWDELRRGDTRRIRDWARLLASAGWNAVCPTEINWEFRNNFLDHLEEVKTLAGIFREYGIRLYWSPNYLLALRPDTAERLYAAVPDFGGYLLKLGSEAQEGDPRPAMVNRIADQLQPHGGHALVRAFVYGKYRYSPDDIRNLNPYDIIAPGDGQYRENVVIVSKGSPLDWDFSAPIPALDGAIQKNLYGSELVIAKNWPLSWIEKWKWWLEQDNYRQGPGSLNKFEARCIVGVAMINPAPGWTACPLNMVNYYGLGRLAQNPDLTVDEIYTEWIRLTFGDDPEVLATVKTILLLSDDATRKLYHYRGYRGIWIDLRDKTDLVQNKTPHTITPLGVGPATPALRERVLAQYAPGLREIYGDPIRGEEFFASFNFLPLDHRLSTGRTVIQDLFANPDEAVQLAALLPQLWQRLEGKIEGRQFKLTLDSLNEWARKTQRLRAATIKGVENVTGRRHDQAVGELAADQRAGSRFFNVQDFGAHGDGQGNNASAINAAIDACHAAGGGTVFVPSGIYATGSIRLQSNVTLALDSGAVLRALAGAMNPWEPNPHDQGLMDPAYYHWQASLLWGENLQNVKIVGPGTIDGSALTTSSKVPAGVGDKAIALKQCRGVEIRNLKIAQGGHYAILASGCTDVLIDNVTINTKRDGIDLMQCRNVVISNSQIDCLRREDGRPAGGDDAIKLGSDYSLGGVWPSENIVVRDCVLASGCNALQFGSETIGAFKNVRFENIRILAAGKAGIGITSNDGSVIENVVCRDITMEQTFLPIFIKLSDVARVPAGAYERGAIRNIRFENITASNCGHPVTGAEMPSVIWGKPGAPIEDIEFRNVSITVKGGGTLQQAALTPAENDARFPKDLGALPAYGWYLRNVRNVRFNGGRFGFDATEPRAAVVADAVDGVVFTGCELQLGGARETAIDLRNGARVTVSPAGSPQPGGRR